MSNVPGRVKTHALASNALRGHCRIDFAWFLDGGAEGVLDLHQHILSQINVLA
jgi:hypothetical protein